MMLVMLVRMLEVMMMVDMTDGDGDDGDGRRVCYRVILVWRDVLNYFWDRRRTKEQESSVCERSSEQNQAHKTSKPGFASRLQSLFLFSFDRTDVNFAYFLPR